MNDPNWVDNPLVCSTLLSNDREHHSGHSLAAKASSLRLIRMKIGSVRFAAMTTLSNGFDNGKWSSLCFSSWCMMEYIFPTLGRWSMAIIWLWKEAYESLSPIRNWNIRSVYCICMSSLSATHEQIRDDNECVQLIPIGFDCIVIDNNKYLILTQVTYIIFLAFNAIFMAFSRGCNFHRWAGWKPKPLQDDQQNEGNMRTTHYWFL